jgi:hypothetical protein
MVIGKLSTRYYVQCVARLFRSAELGVQLPQVIVAARATGSEANTLLSRSCTLRSERSDTLLANVGDSVTGLKWRKSMAALSSLMGPSR